MITSVDAVIERYYRSRASGGRKTLKQIAQEAGYNYPYLSLCKSRYDAAGKWGSRGKRSTAPRRGYARLPRKKAA